MKNVRYNVGVIAHTIAYNDYHSPSFLVVSPSYQGKSAIARRLARELPSTWIIPPASISRLSDLFLQHTGTRMFIFDEPYDWLAGDMKNCFMTLKHLLEGMIMPPRNTRFSTTQPRKLSRNMAIMLFCNERQYDTVRSIADGCGLLERTVEIRTCHSRPETLSYIAEKYSDSAGIKRFFTPIKPRDLTENEKRIIAEAYSGYQQKTVTWVARIMPPEQFAALFPYLTSGRDCVFSDEEVEFE